MKWIPIIILAFIAATLIGIVLITIKVSKKIKFPQNKVNITYTSTSTNDNEFDSSTDTLKKSIEETGSKYKDLSEQLANFINTLNQDEDDEDEDDEDDEDLDLSDFKFFSTLFK